ncbi:hypothetical protein ES703_90893 [subsurface metagenome]
MANRKQVIVVHGIDVHIIQVREVNVPFCQIRERFGERHVVQAVPFKDYLLVRIHFEKTPALEHGVGASPGNDLTHVYLTIVASPHNGISVGQHDEATSIRTRENIDYSKALIFEKETLSLDLDGNEPVGQHQLMHKILILAIK